MTLAQSVRRAKRAETETTEHRVGISTNEKIYFALLQVNQDPKARRASEEPPGHPETKAKLRKVGKLIGEGMGRF